MCIRDSDERGQGNAVGIVEVAIAIDREIDDGEEGIGTVSYTHLDVYKRQVFQLQRTAFLRFLAKRCVLLSTLQQITF